MYIYISDIDIDNAVRTIDLSLEFVHFSGFLALPADGGKPTLNILYALYPSLP